jgi:regulatory protein
MKVTNIKQQVKRADRYSIYIDEKYLFSLSESELLNVGLRIGQEYNETELQDLLQKAVIDKAYDRALNLIMRRARSEWELRQYLKQKEYEPEIINTILNMLSKRGYVDDADFARRWIENRRLLKSTSKRRLTQELRQKRVPDDIISQALEADETDEQQVLKELITKKQTQTRYQDPQKLMQYLMRQGYNYDDIKSVLRDE